MMLAKTLLMALATVLVVLPPVQVLAQGETADDPIVVTTCAELNGMRNNLRPPDLDTFMWCRAQAVTF